MLEYYFDKMENENVRNLAVYNKMIKRLFEVTGKLRTHENFTKTKIHPETKERIKRVFLKLWQVLNVQIKDDKNMKRYFLANLIEMMKELRRVDIWDKRFLEVGEFVVENTDNKCDLLECLVFVKKNETGNKLYNYLELNKKKRK